VNYFGDIVNGRIDLSPVGKIAEFELGKTMRTADHVLVDSWTIMPNHIHIIFRILPQKPSPGYRSGRHPGNLPVIIREFKSAVKRWTNLYGFEFRWQARYHDHRVRNDRELERIRWYIRNNARVWPSDSMNR
jgi:REP element-mobilizing transposase RayT